MNDLPTLSEEEIQEWTDSRSFSRGESYYEDGAIANPRTQGMQLLGDCRGSAPAPYRVTVMLGEDGIAAASCSCPVGGGCKHCVALLLTWLYEPESFVTQEMTQKRLADRSREELVALIEQMISHYPDLADLLEMPIAGVSAPSSGLDPAVIRRQVSNAMDNAGYDDWRGGYSDPSTQLYAIAQQGDRYLAAGEWANAVVVYVALAEEVMGSYEDIYDEEGEIVTVIDSCAEGIGLCLAEETDPALRGEIIQALFDIYHWDLTQGGIGGGDNAHSALLEQTDSDEKAAVAELVEAAFTAPKTASASDWRTKHLGGFLIQLRADTLSDEEYLRLCRETGRTEDLVQRLLALGRSAEAADTTRQAEANETVTLSKLIYAAGHTALAEKLLQEQVGRANDRNILSQLIEWTLARDAAPEALALALRLFGQSKHLAAYRQVREIAGLAGRWTEVQADLLGGLEKEGNFPLLTEIYVDEKRVDDALAALKRIGESGRRHFYYQPASLSLSVARLAEESRPHAAIELYRAEAERSIGGRNRSTYAVAASYLQRVKVVYEQLGERARWEAFIAQIRQENKRLPALQDELSKARL